MNAHFSYDVLSTKARKRSLSSHRNTQPPPSSRKAWLCVGSIVNCSRRWVLCAVGPRVCDEKGQKNNGEKERAGDVMWRGWVKGKVRVKWNRGSWKRWCQDNTSVQRRYTCLHCVARGTPLGKEKYQASYIFKWGGRPNRYLCFFFKVIFFNDFGLF